MLFCRWRREVNSNSEEVSDDDDDDDDNTVWLFFFAAVGCTIGSTAILSSLIFYNATLGEGSYLSLNLALFAPMLPITVAQAVWDTEFDRRFHSQRSNAFRGWIGYAMTIVSALLQPLASHSLVLAAMNAGLMGLGSAILHGMLKQISSMVCRDGRMSASVTGGMQASAVVVLGFSATTGFGHSSSANGLDSFFLLVALVEVACAGCFFRLLSSSQRIMNTMVRRDSSIQGIALLVTRSYTNYDEEDDDNVDIVDPDTAELPSREVFAAAELSTRELFLKTWPACFVIGTTVASSMLVSSCFDRVSSQFETFEALPQVLFYTRLFADLFGRPTTLVFRPPSPAALVALSLMRLLFVPIFFLYTNTTILPKNDIIAVMAIFLFALSSGYFATASYQIAPSLLPDDIRDLNRGWQASLINVCFSASIMIGLFASLAMVTGD